MAIVWPPGLPTAPQLGSYVKRLPKLTIRSSVDAGYDKVRRRFTAAPTLVDMALKLTRTQVAVFRTFFLDTTAGGALAFTWKDHETGDVCDYRFVDEPKLRALAPRQSGSEYWETEVFTLEQLPTEDSDSGGDPPADPFGGFFVREFEREALSEADGEVSSFGAPIAEPDAPATGYYFWLLEAVGDTPAEGAGDDLNLAQLYGESAGTCGSSGGSHTTDTDTSTFLGRSNSNGNLGSTGGGYLDC